jgi:hypothetical protein
MKFSAKVLALTLCLFAPTALSGQLLAERGLGSLGQLEANS